MPALLLVRSILCASGLRMVVTAANGLFLGRGRGGEFGWMGGWISAVRVELIQRVGVKRWRVAAKIKRMRRGVVLFKGGRFVL